MVNPRYARDTRPEAHAAQIAAYRRLGGDGRVRQAIALSEDARAIAMAGIRSRHAEYDEAQVRHALFRLLLGDASYRAAWPDHALLAP